MAVKYSVCCDQQKGKYLVATDHIYPGETILEEEPLVCSQFLWNAECKYDACQFCLSPLETAEESVSRLTKQPTSLPYVEQCCPTDKTKHCSCDCGERYCCEECRVNAYNHFHNYLCPLQLSPEELVNIDKLCQLWKSIHHPPETTSIMLLVKILVLIKQDESLHSIMQQFKFNTAEESREKLFGPKFQEQQPVLRQLISSLLKDDEMVKPYLTENGFLCMIDLVGQYGQAIGTSAFKKWAENCQRLLANNPEELLRINQLIDTLFEKIEEQTGVNFINNGGSGLFKMHTEINHSCEPNAKVKFPHNNSRLSLKASKNIAPGEEITICFLDEYWKNSSRHSRRKYLLNNYLFSCECCKCQRQINDPDVTSDEDAEQEEESDINSDASDVMNWD